MAMASILAPRAARKDVLPHGVSPHLPAKFFARPRLFRLRESRAVAELCISSALPGHIND